MTQTSAARQQDRPDAAAPVDIARYLPLVERVAARVARRLPFHVVRDDLVSAGVVGLLECAPRFDAARGESFEAFAEFRVKGAILDELRGADPLSRDMRRHLNDVRDATHRLEGALGRAPEEDEIAQALGLSLDAYRELLGKLGGHSVVSLSELESGAVQLAAETEDPCAEAVDGETRAQIAMAIETLPARQRQVLWLYYFEEMSLKAIGALLGVTESRVCQIHTQATRALRAQLLHLV
jgi:RNA polymerase sigma factor for flagellar operon FliA